MSLQGQPPRTDAHVHVWGDPDVDRFRVRGVRPVVARPYPPERLLADLDSAGIDRACLVTPLLHGFDNGYASAAARSAPERLAVFGRIDLSADWRSAVDALVAAGAIGVRVHAAAQQVDDTTIRSLLGLTREGRLAAAIYAPASTRLIRAVAEAASGPLWIDHCGLPAAGERGADQAALATAYQLVDDLADAAHVVLKLSALPALENRFGTGPLRALIRRAWERWGAGRLAWGSDAPRMLDRGDSYRDVVTCGERLLHPIAEDERADVWRAAAARLWPPAPGAPSPD